MRNASIPVGCIPQYSRTNFPIQKSHIPNLGSIVIQIHKAGTGDDEEDGGAGFPHVGQQQGVEEAESARLVSSRRWLEFSEREWWTRGGQ